MSAPKDNKERADSTYVQRRNNRAADQDRRKHILYGVVGGVIAVLAIALLVWDSGFFQKRSTAVTIDGEDFGPAVVQYYYQQAYVNAYYGAMMGASTFDPNTDPADQMYDEEKGQTWRDYLLEQGIDQLTQVTMLCHAAEEAGYSMTALDESYLQLQLDSLDRSWRTSGNYANLKSYLKTNYGTFMDEDTFRGIAADRVLASSYQQSHQDSLTYTDEEVNAYYAEHTNELDTFGYSVFTIQAAVQEETDEEGNPVEKSDEEKAAEFETAKADALALAQELQARAWARSMGTRSTTLPLISPPWAPISPAPSTPTGCMTLPVRRETSLWRRMTAATALSTTTMWSNLTAAPGTSPAPRTSVTS